MAIQAVDILRALYQKRSYLFFDGPAAFDLNIFGCRRAQGVNLFDDILGIAYRPAENADFVVEVWPGTTDPGRTYLRDPRNSAGATAIVVPDQYRGLWALGKHRGKDPAFVQVGEVAVFRDGDRDEVLDMDPKTIARGIFGINGHHAGVDSQRVDDWSAGCQVWKRRADHDRALELGRAQVAAHPTWTKFTYTLFDAAQDPLAAALFLDSSYRP